MVASTQEQQLVKAIRQEHARIVSFAKTALGDVSGCSGDCWICAQRVRNCEMCQTLNELYAQLLELQQTAIHVALDGLYTREVL